jgi:Ion channel
MLLLSTRRGATLLILMLGLVSTLSLLLADFSWFYWLYGGVENFTRQLTHLDAVYFAVGTLSTAGTGNLSATSETARAIQAAQMLVDLGLTLFAVGVVVAHFAIPARSRRPADRPPQDPQPPEHEAGKA